jgi:hypothetical protein
VALTNDETFGRYQRPNLYMEQLNEARRSEYRRLRADYDAAYGRLCAEQLRSQNTADQACFEEALSAYRECRDRLARFLVSSEAESFAAVRAPGIRSEAAFTPASTC